MTHQELWQRMLDAELRILDLELIVFQNDAQKIAEINARLEAKRDELRAAKSVPWIGESAPGVQ